MEIVSSVLIGQVIRECRTSRGLSQEVVSGLAPLHRTHYSKIERGERSPTIDTLFKIAHAMDMAPHDLVIKIEAAVEKSFVDSGGRD